MVWDFSERRPPEFTCEVADDEGVARETQPLVAFWASGEGKKSFS